MNLGDVLELVEILAIAYLLVKSFKFTPNPDLDVHMDEFLGLDVFKSDSQFDKGRQVANLEIIKLLLAYAAENPSQRFGQILRNTGILQDIGVKDSSRQEWETPDYYIDRVLVHEEPQIILARMKKELEEQGRR